jgi:hypothetical protein
MNYSFEDLLPRKEGKLASSKAQSGSLEDFFCESLNPHQSLTPSANVLDILTVFFSVNKLLSSKLLHASHRSSGMQIDKVLLKKPGSRIAQKTREQDYEKLSLFILTVLEQCGSEGITLQDLVEQAKQKFNSDFKGNVSWYLLEVKHDLELRKLILKTISPQREQIIRLNAQKKWWFN